MNENFNNQNKEMTVDEEIARMKENFRAARFGNYEGIENTRFKKRVVTVRTALCKEIELENKDFDAAKRNDKADSIFMPRLQEMYELHEKAVQERLDKAKREMAAELKKNNVELGRMAARVRKTIDVKLDAESKRVLAEEVKLVKSLEKNTKNYIKNAPEGSTIKLKSYDNMYQENIKDNKKSLSLAEEYLKARATRQKYEEYEKNGVITEGEKRICAIAKEIEEAAKLRLENFKDYAYFKQEKIISNSIMSAEMLQKQGKLLRESELQLAAIVMPREDREKILAQRLDRSEERYYNALREKRDLEGFHPFKKIALNIQISKAADEYNRALTRFNKDKEEKDKRPPLTTLAEKEKSDKELYSFVLEKFIESDDEYVMTEEPIEQPAHEKHTIQLDLSDALNKKKEAFAPQREEKQANIDLIKEQVVETPEV